MLSLSNIPFLRLTVSLALGIALALFAVNTPVSDAQWVFLSAVALVFIVLSIWIIEYKKLVPLAGFCMLLAFIILGFILGYHSQAINSNQFFMKPGTEKNFKVFRIRLQDDIADKKNTWRAPATVVSAIDTNGFEYLVSGDLLVYWPKSGNDKMPGFVYGDELIVPNSVISMPSSAFPGDFDFKAVMRYRNVQHQLFLKGGIEKKVRNSGNRIIALSFKIRNTLIQYFQSHFQPRHAAILESLLIGYKDQVQKDDLNAFAISGTMHVLAVSGMHAGLLYMVLVFIFTGKRKTQRLRIYQGLIVILLLWAFAVITGLTASVVRAAIMFTILEFGRSVLKKDGNIINSLFAAAFIQLVFNPLQLIDVGFQLSYLAVLGIVVLYPWFIGLWAPPGKWLFLLYQSALISISATIATLPVTLYFFGNFPLWFLPANMIIVPLSTLLIFMALITVSLSWLPLVSGLMITITTWVSYSLLEITGFIAGLPSASIQGLQPDLVGVFLLLTIVVSVTLFFAYKLKGGLWFSSFCALLFALWHLRLNYLSKHASELVFCELKGKLVAVLREGTSATVYSTDIPLSTADSLSHYMQNYFQKAGVVHTEWKLVDGNSYRHTNVIFNAAYPVSVITPIRGKQSVKIAWTMVNGKDFTNLTDKLVIQSRYRRSIPQNSQNTTVLHNDFCVIPLPALP